jgi:hypothetical protein
MISFSLIDTETTADFRVFLLRAAQVDGDAVRLIACGNMLAVYAPVLFPRGLLDNTPTVLGLRIFGLADKQFFDVVLPPRTMLDRLTYLGIDENGVEVQLPPSGAGISWSGVSPPRTGWESMESVSVNLLESIARSGIDEVTHALPANAKGHILHKVRCEVWGRPLPGYESIVAGAAFAAFSFGFLHPEDPVTIFRVGTWTRLTSTRGHVLIRSASSAS